MKKLSIEEKAKAYDEVRDKIAIRFGSNVAKEIFSEYEESEDERIRKNLISCISTLKHPLFSERERKEFIAWLEKQGEHNKFRDSIQVDDRVTRNQDGMIVNLSQLQRVAKQADDDVRDTCEDKGAPGSTELIEEQYEKKPAKWSDEDHLHFKRCLGYIEAYVTPRKDDVKWFKGLEERNNCGQSYVEQKRWTEEDERLRNTTVSFLDEFKSKGYENAVECIDWLKSMESYPKIDWDENKIAEIGRCLYEYYPEDKAKELFSWLKSFEILSEWTEDDKNRFNNLCRIIDQSNENSVTKEGFKRWLFSLRHLSDYKKKYEEAVLRMKQRVEAGIIDECYADSIFSESKEDKNMLDRAIYMMEQLDMTQSWDDVYSWLKSLK